jgi:hypothetical protein
MGGGGLPALTGEGVVGAAFSVVHARLVERHAEPLVGLLNPLMAMIVLPYRGRAAAARELARPVSVPRCSAGASGGGSGRRVGLVAPVDFRLTVRRHAALSAVAELCARGGDPSNREVSERVGIADEGQVSRLMMGLRAQGFLQDTRAGEPGNRKAWRLTPRGEAVLLANRPVGGRVA